MLIWFILSLLHLYRHVSDVVHTDDPLVVKVKSATDPLGLRRAGFQIL